MKPRKLILAMMLALTSFNSWAQASNYPSDYYMPANGLSGEALKTALYKIITKKSVVSYAGLINAYKKTDTRADGYLRDWYSNTTYFVPGSASSSYSKEGDTYNREHLVPQSWFGKGSPMKSDITHVVPTDGYVNNRRSAYPLAEVGTTTYTSNNNYSKLGKCKTSGYSGTVFEPNDEVKGDIARIYFYMVTCYEDKISSWVENATASYVFDGNTYPGLTDWYLNMLMRWAKLDPVDDVEIARNNAVYEVQHNRNPFVDYPGLEEYIWGDKQNERFIYNNYDGTSTAVPSPAFSPKQGTYATTQYVTLSASTSDCIIYYAIGDGDYQEYDGRAITVSETTTISAYVVKGSERSNVTTATYIINANTPYNSTAFVKVTTAEQLVAGGEFILVNETNKKAAGPVNNSYLTASEVEIYNGIVTEKENNSILIFTLGGTSGGYSLKTNNKYLTASTAKSLSLSNTESKMWTISSTSDGYTVSGSSTVGTIQYNTGSPRFLNYTSNQSPAVLYLKTAIDLRNDAGIDFAEKTFEVEEESDFTAPTLINPNNLIGITYSSNDEEVAYVDEEEGYVIIGKPGTATITATFAGNNDYKEATVSYTITVTEKPIAGEIKEYTVTFNFPEKDYGMTLLSGNSQEYNPNPTSISEDDVTVTMSGNNGSRYWKAQNGNELRVYKSCTMTISVPENALIRKIVFAGDAVTSIQHDGTNLTGKTWEGEEQSVSFTFTATQKINTIDVTYEIEEESPANSIDVRIGTSGFSSLYYSKKNLIVPNYISATAYIVSDGQLIPTKEYLPCDIIPAGTGVILYTDRNTEDVYSFLFTDEEGVAPAANMLLGFDKDARTTAADGGTEGYKFYRLAVSDNADETGFYYGAGNGVPFTSEAYKAYLCVPADDANDIDAFIINMVPEEEPLVDNYGDCDSINRYELNLEERNHSSILYDLQGRKVEANDGLKKGIYIYNNKIIIIK